MLHIAHPGSGLWRLLEGGEEEPRAPYWAYPWAGGMVLARFVLEHPEWVRGRRVLDFGAGSGLVGIAAAKAGATRVIAAETDSNGVVAIGLNAAANAVSLEVRGDDLTNAPLPEVDLVLAGDVFYDPATAERVTPFLDRCLDAGIVVLVGDPYRAPLPLARLRLLGQYAVPDFGVSKDSEANPSGVFAFEPVGGARP